jgi:hypothetical protein
MEHLGKFSIASMADSTLITRFSMLKLELSNSFGSRVACELARASSLTQRAKLVARLVKNLIESSKSSRATNDTSFRLTVQPC